MPRFYGTAFDTMKPGDVYRDDRVKGLQLRRRGRAHTWELYYVFNGEQRRPKLADYPSLGLHAARDVARERLRQVSQGVDFGAERKAARQAPTVDHLVELFKADMQRRLRAGKLKPRTIEEYTRHLDQHILRKFGPKKIARVSKEDVNRFLDALSQEHPTNANRVRATLSSLFQFAEDYEPPFRPRHTNPVHRTLVNTERRRKRVASAEETAAMLRALGRFSHEYPAHVAAIMVILFAGTRVTELVTARKSELIGDTINRAEHKTQRTGEERKIILPRQALEILATLPNDGTDYLFGKALAGQKEPRYSIFRIWEMARAEVAQEIPSISDLRVMDLRRTFATVAKSQGVSLNQIGDIFGHRDAETTTRYAFLFPSAARDAVQAVADGIDLMVALPPPSPPTPRFRGFRRVLRQKQRIEPRAADPALSE